MYSGIMTEQDAYKASLIRLERLSKALVRIEKLSKALEIAVRQNECDMLMTGEEIRAARLVLYGQDL